MVTPDFNALRSAMVERQIKARGIHDPRLLDAFLAIPRELFVPPDYQASAYDDRPLPIGEGQTISQPYIVALMIASAAVGPDDQVLEVGAGSGYAAALLGRIAAKVVAVERISSLADDARKRLGELGLTNIDIVTGDGSKALLSRGPFDAILVAAAARRVPPALLKQLRCPGGRLVMPVGLGGWTQKLIKMTRLGPDEFASEALCGVRFVPLIEGEG